MQKILDRLKDDFVEYLNEIENEFLVTEAKTDVYDLRAEQESILNKSDNLFA